MWTSKYMLQHVLSLKISPEPKILHLFHLSATEDPRNSAGNVFLTFFPTALSQIPSRSTMGRQFPASFVLKLQFIARSNGRWPIFSMGSGFTFALGPKFWHTSLLTFFQDSLKVSVNFWPHRHWSEQLSQFSHFFGPLRCGEIQIFTFFRGRIAKAIAQNHFGLQFQGKF